MNVVQLIRKARLGCDAILPGAVPSSQWDDDELVDLASEAHDEVCLRLRKARAKWFYQTVTTASSPMVRSGETWTPATALAVVSGQSRVTLPPDFGEVMTLRSTTDASLRFEPADATSLGWVDSDLGALQSDGTFVGAPPAGMVYYYDIVGPRTLMLTPPMQAGTSLQLDYAPQPFPLYLTTRGTVTVTQGSANVVGVGTTWVTDGLYSEASGSAAELMVGISGLGDSTVSLMQDYPRVASIDTETTLTLVSAWGGLDASAQPYTLAMAPIVPRTYHRWIGGLTAAYMLRKINPDLADKYAQDLLRRFAETIGPTATQRQVQRSRVTEANDLLG